MLKVSILHLPFSYVGGPEAGGIKPETLNPNPKSSTFACMWNRRLRLLFKGLGFWDLSLTFLGLPAAYMFQGCEWIDCKP